jgi:hypothetical protein
LAGQVNLGSPQDKFLMGTFYHESNQQGGFDFMCVPPELRCDFKTHASALCATPEAWAAFIIGNQLQDRLVIFRYPA